jgi:hypothetical protein
VLALAAEGAAMSIAALLMLLVYVAVAAILTPRELTFLSSVAQPQRGFFIAQDVILQVCILLVLVPAVLYPRFVSQPAAYIALIVIIVGFTLLWITIVWMVVGRQRYIHQILREATRESREQLARLSSQLNKEQEENGE